MNMYIVILLFVFVGIWYHWRRKNMNLLRKNGIPGNKPHLIFGNLFQMNKLSPIERENMLIGRFGKVVGYYTGAKTNILVADPELAKRILNKDFHNFMNRSVLLKYIHPSYKANSALLIAKNQQWKQIRGLISPAFSAHKLKEMMIILEESIDSFIKIIDTVSESKEEFNIYYYYQRLTIEIIIKTTFGIELDAQNGSHCNILKNVNLYIETKINKIVLILFVCFPELSNIILFLRAYYQELIFPRFGFYPIVYLRNICAQIIKIRKKQPRKQFNDILQTMIGLEVCNNETSNIIETIDEKGTELPQKDEIKLNLKGNFINLNEDQIIANCLNLLLAGSETTSTTLAYVTHMLINYPDIQEKVRNEISYLYECEGKFDFNNIEKLQYMECVINETMRIYPPVVNGTTRECAEDYKYNDITIPKGATIWICTHYLHNDPDYWTEPERFDPMRFSPQQRHKINVGSFQPFGSGPRNCIGNRLAYVIIKLNLAKLLLKYRLETGPSTEIGNLATKFKISSVAPKNGVFVIANKI